MWLYECAMDLTWRCTSHARDLSHSGDNVGLPHNRGMNRRNAQAYTAEVFVWSVFPYLRWLTW